MRITVGSKNEAKVAAVQELIREYPLLAQAEVVPFDVAVPLYGHPKSIDEIVAGALERAKNAFVDCAYSFGIESGLFAVSHSKSGFLDTCCCAIFDGTKYHLGFSPAFEYPKQVMDYIMNHGMDASQAYRAAGLTNHEKIGRADGAISHLTNGRINRKDYTKLAIMMALMHLEHPELY